MRRTIIATVVLSSLAVASVAGAQMLRSGYDEPDYELLDQEKPFEIRRYDRRIVAETTVRAARLRDATSIGFGRLADFIFGGNETPEGDSAKIAMTTPVESRPASDGEYKVVFTMPPKYTLDNLPRPNDPRVNVRALAPRTVAVARFGGVARNKDVSALEAELRAYAKERGYDIASPVTIAQYDPPWIPGFLRRNELMFVVEARD